MSIIFFADFLDLLIQKAWTVVCAIRCCVTLYLATLLTQTVTQKDQAISEARRRPVEANLCANFSAQNGLFVEVFPGHSCVFGRCENKAKVRNSFHG